MGTTRDFCHVDTQQTLEEKVANRIIQLINTPLDNEWEVKFVNLSGFERFIKNPNWYKQYLSSLVESSLPSQIRRVGWNTLALIVQPVVPIKYDYNNFVEDYISILNSIAGAEDNQRIKINNIIRDNNYITVYNAGAVDYLKIYTRHEQVTDESKRTYTVTVYRPTEWRLHLDNFGTKLEYIRGDGLTVYHGIKIDKTLPRDPYALLGYLVYRTLNRQLQHLKSITPENVRILLYNIEKSLTLDPLNYIARHYEPTKIRVIKNKRYVPKNYKLVLMALENRKTGNWRVVVGLPCRTIIEIILNKSIFNKHNIKIYTKGSNLYVCAHT